ncbi:uncharacterized protein LOC6530139 [Drosophila yakuba]|uniref:Uncharacterized protein n=1 Tax=Drosophila yakuba TaxID=7245 RepID=B4P5D5_DROYA|nr:uncharacterized protein LOC6530139 [Drosophila yakuba]EDW90797.1 uncharacterized protein Dyak_GE12436 [Drosophila yakuba]
MDITKTSSAEETDNTENNTSHARNLHENVSKFYATIGNISRNMRKDDWTYLQRHPEIRAIIRVITAEAVKARPSNIYQFAAKLFVSERDEEMVEKINKQLKWLDEQLRGGTWSPAEGCAQFPESSETSSETKCTTPAENLNVIEKEVCPENFKPNCKKC